MRINWGQIPINFDPQLGSDDQLIAVMRDHGFAPFGYDPFARRLVDGEI